MNDHLPITPLTAASSINTPGRRGFRRFLLWTAGIVFAGLWVLAAGVFSFAIPGPDIRALRNGVFEATSLTREWAIQVNVRPFVFGLCRPVLNWFELEPEVRTALCAVKAAEVGVYRLHSSASANAGTAALVAADRLMTRRGWTRVVGAQERDSLVAVYVPTEQSAATSLKSCVLVLNGEQLVLVAARGDVAALAEVAWAKMPGRRPGKLAANHLAALKAARP